jgi:DNA-binding MarR family transcriptional regulator
MADHRQNKQTAVAFYSEALNDKRPEEAGRRMAVLGYMHANESNDGAEGSTMMRDSPTSAAALALPDHRDGYACARAWSALAAAHATVTERLGLALMDATGLSINDFEVLLRVDGVPPPGLRLGDLQQTVRLSQPALSRMAARLENRALLRRAGDPTDRRGVVLTITPAGQRLLRQAVAVHAKTLQAILLDQLSPDEHDQLADMLDRIVKGSPT